MILAFDNKKCVHGVCVCVFCWFMHVCERICIDSSSIGQMRSTTLFDTFDDKPRMTIRTNDGNKCNVGRSMSGGDAYGGGRGKGIKNKMQYKEHTKHVYEMW